MFDPIQKALDVYGILLSAPQLSNVNVVFYRKLYLQNTSDYMRAITAQRNNGSGAGIIVLEPWARCNQKNVLIFDWIFPVVSVENPTINMMQGGSNLSAYQMAQNVADILHNYADDANGTMNCDSEAIQDETEVSFEGCVSKRTNLHILGRSAQTVRCGTIQQSISGGTVTLSCSANPSASIFYTLDGSFPAQTGNASSKKYTGPVAGQSGQTLRAVAYQTGYNNSAAISVPFP